MNTKLFKVRKIAAIVLAVFTALFFVGFALACMSAIPLDIIKNSYILKKVFDYLLGQSYIAFLRPSLAYFVSSIFKALSYALILLPFLLMTIPLFFQKKVHLSSFALLSIICFCLFLALDSLQEILPYFSPYESLHPIKLFIGIDLTFRSYSYAIFPKISTAIYCLSLAATLSLVAICLILKKHTCTVAGKIVKIAFDVLCILSFLPLLVACAHTFFINIYTIVCLFARGYWDVSTVLPMICYILLFLFNIFFVSVLPVGIALFKVTADVIPVQSCKRKDEPVDTVVQ